MTVHINGSKGKELYYNGVKIKEAYYNGNKVYSGEPLARCYKGDGSTFTGYLYVLKGQSTGTLAYQSNSGVSNMANSISGLEYYPLGDITSYTEETLNYYAFGKSFTLYRYKLDDLYT